MCCSLVVQRCKCRSRLARLVVQLARVDSELDARPQLRSASHAAAWLDDARAASALAASLSSNPGTGDMAVRAQASLLAAQRALATNAGELLAVLQVRGCQTSMEFGWLKIAFP